MNNVSASSQTPSETTPELFGTGFHRGRAELSSNPSRELINVPYDDRWRNRKRVSLCHSAGLPTPVVTPEGAVLTANFDTVPVEPDSHALSFRQVDSPGDSSPPPAYRFSWRRWSREWLCKKEKERGKEKTGSMRRGSTVASIRPSIQSQRHDCERVEEDKEGEERKKSEYEVLRPATCTDDRCPNTVHRGLLLLFPTQFLCFLLFTFAFSLPVLLTVSTILLESTLLNRDSAPMPA
jgi:hypothetical protein